MTEPVPSHPDDDIEPGEYEPVDLSGEDLPDDTWVDEDILLDDADESDPP